MQIHKLRHDFVEIPILYFAGGGSTFASIQRTVDGIKPKGFDIESQKPNSPRKNQKLGTIVHLPARMDAIFKKIILTLQAASAYTHFRGGVWAQMPSLWKMV